MDVGGVRRSPYIDLGRVCIWFMKGDGGGGGVHGRSCCNARGVHGVVAMLQMQEVCTELFPVTNSTPRLRLIRSFIHRVSISVCLSHRTKLK